MKNGKIDNVFLMMVSPSDDCDDADEMTKIICK